jgi:hypothetical protein
LSPLSPALKRQEKSSKSIFDSEQDQQAYEAGWLVLSPGEAYEKRLTLYSSIYLFKTNTAWILWRASWSPGGPKPRGEKKLGTFKTFEQALERGQSYVDWRMKKR